MGTADPQSDDEAVDRTRTENRYFIKVILGEQPYLAQFFPGATISVVGPRVVGQFKDRLRSPS